MAGTLAVAPLGAEAPQPFPEFSAKRVKPPKAGNQSRINIQIEPKPVVKKAPVVAAARPARQVRPTWAGLVGFGIRSPPMPLKRGQGVLTLR